jgi:hypothetical protein|tara:strand:- start:1412 stop:1645 length:234 start_codon:yes stop_codon:yes gene_type:complete
MEYLIGYLILSLIVMVLFVEVNKKQILKNYLNFENRYDRQPTNGWYNFYIFTHFLKAPLLCPMIVLLILGNGGKIIK